MEPIIVARDLKKIYRTANVKIKALNGVDIEIMSGESCAILGTSGSGKSTLLSLLAGLEHPTGGKIYIKKKPIYKMNEKELVDFRLRHIGFVFQSFNLMATMTAVENVALPLMFRGVPHKERVRAAKKLLIEMGLKQQLNSKPMEMSGGQQQRVSIGRALINSPALVLADEPTGNLDRKNSEEIVELLKYSNRKYRQTLIVITHDESIALKADRILSIEDGRIIRDERLRGQTEKGAQHNG